MRSMYAVEVADAQHCGPEVGWNIVQMAEDAHG
jgi:hypothetical protein